MQFDHVRSLRRLVALVRHVAMVNTNKSSLLFLEGQFSNSPSRTVQLIAALILRLHFDVLEPANKVTDVSSYPGIVCTFSSIIR